MSIISRQTRNNVKLSSTTRAPQCSLFMLGIRLELEIQYCHNALPMISNTTSDFICYDALLNDYLIYSASHLCNSREIHAAKVTNSIFFKAELYYVVVIPCNIKFSA